MIARLVALAAAVVLACAPAAAQLDVRTLPLASTLTGSERSPAVQGSGCPGKTTPCANVVVTPDLVRAYVAQTLQAKDADLDAIAALTTQPFGRGLLTQADAAAARTTLGVTATGQDTTYLWRASNLSGLTDVSAARGNLGLGTLATQGAGAVAITGGTITGITDLAIADGGTGASTAAAARTNLGLAIGSNVQAYDATILTGQTAAPTLALLSGAGTGATISQTWSKGGGTVTVVLGANAAAGDLFSATYATPFANRSHVVIFAGNAGSSTVIGRNGYVAATASGFVVSSASPTPSATVVVHYMVQGS